MSGEDFFVSGMFDVTFPALVTEESDIRCASINIINDLELEGDMQSFSIHIGTPNPSNVLVSPIYALVTIQDDDEDGNNNIFT